MNEKNYGGTFAHSDIAFEFASWVSPEFKLYIIKDYKRLKTKENSKLSLSWNLNREISKLNYRVHTDAIKENLIPPVLTPQQISYTYASEADLLNTVLFGKTAKEWRDSNPNEKGNIRYDYFFPMDDAETVLLIDSWENQEAIDNHHKTPMMNKITELREKYNLHMKVERYISEDEIPQSDRKYIRE